MARRRRDAGFSLAALIFFATAASIFIAAGVPAYQMQAKRELEEELIFRGEEYTRAIQKYQRRFGVYPSSVDQLVSTNGLRFLRKAYKDPINGKDFRLILINPDGSLTGSKVFMQQINTQPMFGGNTQQFGGQNNQQQRGQQPGQQQNQQQPQRQFGQPQTQFGQPQTQSGQQQQQGGFGFQSSAQQTQRGFQAGGVNTPTSLTGIQNPAQQQQQRGQQGTGNPFSQPGSPGQGAGQAVTSGGIIGVASDVSEDSVKIYNNRQKYDEWEFIAILNQPGQQGQGQPGQGQPGQGQPGQGQPGQGQPGQGQPGQGGRGNNPFQTPQSPFGGQPQNPFGGQPQNPFGGQPQNPFGGQPQAPGGQRAPNQNPFGFGGPQPAQPGKLP